jgi:hypothetical protein
MTEKQTNAHHSTIICAYSFAEIQRQFPISDDHLTSYQRYL